jgi:putative peptidoglycan lipid II flippase
MNSKAIFSGAFILFVGYLMSSLLGLIREVLSASYYGASVDMDSYLFANAVPSMILYFVSGFLTVGFIPLFIKKKVNYTKEEASLYLSNILNVFMLSMLLIVLLCYFFSHSISAFFAINDIVRLKIKTLLWILLPSIFFFGLSFAQSSILNALNHFKVPAFLTAINNLCVIAFIIIFHQAMGIYSAALGYVVGTVIQVAIQIPILRKLGVTYKFYIRFKDEDLKKIVIVSIPIIGLTIIDNCVMLASRFFSTHLDAGSASALNYASRIVMLPITLFGTALITASYPSAILMQAEKKQHEYNQIVTTSIKSLLLILMPVMFICMVYAPHIIKILFERGAFGVSATAMTAASFIYLSIGIVLSPIKDFITKLFFSKEIVRIPIISSVIFFIIFIGSCLILVPYLKYIAIALAGSFAELISIFYLIIKYNTLDAKNKIHITIPYLLKIIFSCIVSIAASYVLYANCVKLDIFRPVWIELTLFCIGLSLPIYLVIIKLLRIQEIDFVFDKLLSRYKFIKRRGVITNET